MDAFDRLRKNLKKDFSGRFPVRLFLLGDTATQWLAQALRGTGYEHGLDLQVREAGFNQIGQQVFDTGSELYASEPQVILIYHSTQKLLETYNRLDAASRADLAADRIGFVGRLLDALRRRSTAPVIYFNYPESDDGVFGSFSNKVGSSFLYQLRKLNVDLMQFAAAREGFYIGDLAAVQLRVGRPAFYRPSVYVNTEMEIDLAALPAVAAATVAQVGALFGRIRKCLILDLDNTLWGGVIGDDGLGQIQIGTPGIGKAFTEFQHWIRKLRQRGIVLAVCSKNSEATARQPFEEHPDMVLRLADIAVFIANWENKVDNIREIRSILRIGYDSMVLLDDNPFEREMVRAALPDILVPELPGDPADFLEYLAPLHLFETASLTSADADRTAQYRTEQERNEERLAYTDEASYLEGLGMRSEVEPFSRHNAPRVAQLAQRSNQFNLRTVRYTEAELLQLAGTEGVLTFSFTLTDRFGDNGLIAAVVLKPAAAGELFIDNWLMSCRVLRRGMEHFVLNTIATRARERGFRTLRGEYVATAKNELVRDHYRSLGFGEQAGHWVLDLEGFRPSPTPVRGNDN